MSTISSRAMPLKFKKTRSPCRRPVPIWTFRRLGDTSSTSFRRKIAAMSSRGWPRPSPRRRGPTQNGPRAIDLRGWGEPGPLAGEPVIVMHGGPGAGGHSSSARFFNPQRYRVVLFDQRGCGKNTPSASDDDATPALTDNTTQHLIDDVSALRHELNINGKMHVFGGSW